MENGLKIIRKTDRGCRALFIPEAVLRCRFRCRNRGTGAELAVLAAGAWLAAALNLMAVELAGIVCLLCLLGLMRRLRNWKEDCV
jgi:hypothetical protein